MIKVQSESLKISVFNLYTYQSNKPHLFTYIFNNLTDPASYQMERPLVQLYFGEIIQGTI